MRRLGWGVKESFRRYVEDSPSGLVEVRDGASRDSQSIFWFPSTQQAEESTPDGVQRFSGAVQFIGHHGMLSLPIRDPWVEQRGDQWTVSIVDPDEPGSRVDFVIVGEMTFDQSGRARGESVTLTEDGADLILGPYERGTEFDDLEVTS